MESKISCSMVFCKLPNLCGSKLGLYYGVNNLRCIYDLNQNYFSLSLNDLSLEDYHNFF
jgi:hypothetical protein